MVTVQTACKSRKKTTQIDLPNVVVHISKEIISYIELYLTFRFNSFFDVYRIAPLHRSIDDYSVFACNNCYFNLKQKQIANKNINFVGVNRLEIVYPK